MSSEQVPGQLPSSAQAWFARLGLSGKLLAIGGLCGIIVAFLPVVSVSVQMPGGAAVNPFGMQGNPAGINVSGMSLSKTVIVAENWRGMLCLACYVASLVLALVLYPPGGLSQKSLVWGALA